MKKIVTYGLLLLCVPLLIVLGSTVFRGRQYAFFSFAVAVLACGAFFLSLERGERSAARLVLLAVLTALSVLGRVLFAALPGFKPVTAMVVLTALYFGAEAGFLTGAMTALLSNFYFGQGAWTPFQMFAWGVVGLIAGLLADPLKRNLFLLCLYGALAGLLFSLLMDVWSALMLDGGFRLSRYLAIVLTSAPTTALYAVSNVIFLLLLARPVGRKLTRILTKYKI